MRVGPLGALLLLCGCEGESGTAQDGRLRVEEIDLQPILHADFDRNHLFGAACAFMPYADNGAIVAFAQDGAGWLKLGGRLRRLAADKSSAKLPYGAYSRYEGRKLAMELSLENSAPVHAGSDTEDRRGAMAIRERNGHLVYRTRGMVQCGS